MSEEEEGAVNTRPKTKSELSFEITQRQRLKILAECAEVFNSNSENGIKTAIELEVITSEPVEVAKFLLDTKGLSRAQIGKYLGGSDDFHVQVLRCYVNQFSFQSLDLIDSMRVLFATFCLPGEAQIIDRILQFFAERYSACNPEPPFNDPSTTLSLAFSLIMLNTDLHTSEIKRKMSKEQYIENISYAATSIPRPLLSNLYDKIKQNQIKLIKDDCETFPILSRASHQGWLWKAGGRTKTWKKRWFVLKDKLLFYLEDPQDAHPIGTVILTNLTICKSTTRQFGFDLIGSTGNKVYSNKRGNGGVIVSGQHEIFSLTAESDQDYERWIAKIQEELVKA